MKKSLMLTSLTLGLQIILAADSLAISVAERERARRRDLEPDRPAIRREGNAEPQRNVQPQSNVASQGNPQVPEEIRARRRRIQERRRAERERRENEETSTSASGGTSGGNSTGGSQNQGKCVVSWATYAGNGQCYNYCNIGSEIYQVTREGDTVKGASKYNGARSSVNAPNDCGAVIKKLIAATSTKANNSAGTCASLETRDDRPRGANPSGWINGAYVVCSRVPTTTGVQAWVTDSEYGTIYSVPNATPEQCAGSPSPSSVCTATSGLRSLTDRYPTGRLKRFSGIYCAPSMPPACPASENARGGACTRPDGEVVDSVQGTRLGVFAGPGLPDECPSSTPILNLAESSSTSNGATSVTGTNNYAGVVAGGASNSVTTSLVKDTSSCNVPAVRARGADVTGRGCYPRRAIDYVQRSTTIEEYLPALLSVGSACSTSYQCSSFTCRANSSGVRTCEEMWVRRFANVGEAAPGDVKCNPQLSLIKKNGVCVNDTSNRYLGLLAEIEGDKLKTEDIMKSTVAILNLRALEFTLSSISDETDSRDCFKLVPYLRSLGRDLFEHRKDLINGYNKTLSSIETDFDTLMAAQMGDNTKVIMHGESVTNNDLASRRASGYDALKLQWRRELLLLSYEKSMKIKVAELSEKFKKLNEEMATWNGSDTQWKLNGRTYQGADNRCEAKVTQRSTDGSNQMRTIFMVSNANRWVTYYKVPLNETLRTSGYNEVNSYLTYLSGVANPLGRAGNRGTLGDDVSNYFNFDVQLVDPLIPGNLQFRDFGREMSAQPGPRTFRSLDTGGFKKLYGEMREQVKKYYGTLKADSGTKNFVYEPELIIGSNFEGCDGKVKCARDCVENPSNPGCTAYDDLYNLVGDVSFGQFIAYSIAPFGTGNSVYYDYFNNPTNFRRLLFAKVETDLISLYNYYDFLTKEREKRTGDIEKVMNSTIDGSADPDAGIEYLADNNMTGTRGLDYMMSGEGALAAQTYNIESSRTVMRTGSDVPTQSAERTSSNAGIVIEAPSFGSGGSAGGAGTGTPNPAGLGVVAVGNGGAGSGARGVETERVETERDETGTNLPNGVFQQAPPAPAAQNSPVQTDFVRVSVIGKIVSVSRTEITGWACVPGKAGKVELSLFVVGAGNEKPTEIRIFPNGRTEDVVVPPIGKGIAFTTANLPGPAEAPCSSTSNFRFTLSPSVLSVYAGKKIYIQSARAVRAYNAQKSGDENSLGRRGLKEAIRPLAGSGSYRIPYAGPIQAVGVGVPVAASGNAEAPRNVEASKNPEAPVNTPPKRPVPGGIRQQIQ